MDASEATKIVMSRIQALNPENASKLMGCILIQDQGDKEMIRLAFSPDPLLLSYINQAKARFALPPTTPSFYSDFFNFHHDSSPALDPLLTPTDDVTNPHPFHRRSCSLNDAAFLANIDQGAGNGNGFLWRPCMYFARGFCKNGSACKFLHGESGAVDVGSPTTAAGFDELMKLKAFQQQRFELMASGAHNHNPFAYNRCMDEDLGDDLLPMGLGGGASSSARQIYLTFPADSAFKEEDVSNYFSMFGPVQDVRIPYQPKRMFGFVTFVYPETVKLILAKGNPHFVCDSRVLVKPYKEKGKVREKKHLQHLERGEYSACLSPSGIDTRDCPFGPRMLLSPQEMMLRKKLEQEAELQHAIELEGQRMLRLQLRDLKARNHNNHYMQMSPTGIAYSSPRMSQLLMNQHVTASSHSINEDDSEESNGAPEAADEKSMSEGAANSIHGGNQQHLANADCFNLHESMEYGLPDNLFASPSKSAADHQRASSEGADYGTSSNDTPFLPDSSPLTRASLKSCYLQMPRFLSGQEAIEM